MQQHNDALGTEKISKLVVRLSVPSVVAQLINLVYNMVDRIYIGHIPEVGSLALTGIGVCMPLMMILTAFSQLIGAGGAPLAPSRSENRTRPPQNAFSAVVLLR